eukprot:scaffold25763_cov63-Phaeocystis_antarctica.AAC.1
MRKDKSEGLGSEAPSPPSTSGFTAAAPSTYEVSIEGMGREGGVYSRCRRLRRPGSDRCLQTSASPYSPARTVGSCCECCYWSLCASKVLCEMIYLVVDAERGRKIGHRLTTSGGSCVHPSCSSVAHGGGHFGLASPLATLGSTGHD